MAQDKLRFANLDYLLDLGFAKNGENSDDPRDLEYNLKNDNFHLRVDVWGDVYLSRLNTGDDFFIKIDCTDFDELKELIKWITPPTELKN